MAARREEREIEASPLCFNEVVKEGAEKGARVMDGVCFYGNGPTLSSSAGLRTLMNC